MVGMVVFSAGTVWGYTEGASNSFFGSGAGQSSTGTGNNFFGVNAGGINSGSNNTFFGTNAGFFNTTGSSNVILGHTTGGFNSTGSLNTFVGTLSGYSNTIGNGNVFLGASAGYAETGSNKLYISNSDTSTPLIYGEFDNQYLEVNGDLGVNGVIQAQHIYPGFWMDETDGPQKGAYFVLDNGYFQVQRRSTGYGGYEASPISVSVLSPSMSFRLTSNGYVGFGKSTPAYPLDMASGAHVTTGGVWTNASSRDYKENIASLSSESAKATLMNLHPVTYNYKEEKGEQYVGFIAEDVPELVAMNDHKSLSPMDIVAVLTKVVQEQQKMMQEQQLVNEKLQSKIGQLETALQFKQDKDGVFAIAD